MYARMPGQASLGVCVCLCLGALAQPGLPDVTSAPDVMRGFRDVYRGKGERA